ncbi:MAG TPA: dipeptide ABC transporter ATP-binding protein [Dongiaceae bacterium]|jgi:peptide/nickel transport system ATP-binding protein|nr:dipeptide ABC transporter ATP-binding protein [Dongiaceae bacterium]
MGEAGAILKVDDLTVSYGYPGARVAALAGVSFEVAAGEVLGLVGESGSGKTTAALHILGHRPRGATLDKGSVLLRGRDVLKLSQAQVRALRGREVSYVPQNPGGSLNPARRIGRLIVELLEQHGVVKTRQEAWARAEELLAQVRLPDPRGLLQRYPHQISGGQQQRVVIAMAIAARPSLIVLDEPTTGLDVSTQKEILQLLREIRDTQNVAMVYVTHDLHVLREIATHVAVMYAGRTVEIGDIDQVFDAPRHPYTRGLIASVPDIRQSNALPRGLPGTLKRSELPAGCAFAPRCEFAKPSCWRNRQSLETVAGSHMVACECWTALARGAKAHWLHGRTAAETGSAAESVLELRDLCVDYETTSILGFARSARRRVVHHVNMTLRPGEIFALVGESGSGKSTIAKAILGLTAPSSGEIVFDGEALAGDVRHRTDLQRRRISLVFQNPDASLNPHRTAGQILGDALRSFEKVSASEAAERALAALQDVQLPDSYISRYPDQMSGGERQRVAIARALIVRPEVLICDEVLTALDVSVQAGILQLLLRLRTERRLSILFIAHDLAVVRSLADRAGVLYSGQMMAVGEKEALFDAPLHPYSFHLLRALPGAALVEPAVPPKAPAGAAASDGPRKGCPFFSRCLVARPGVCDVADPPARRIEGAVLYCHAEPETLRTAFKFVPEDEPAPDRMIG